uniref:Uncharacterized protein n=1 Tax=Anguilla anguilla TaxID=7936 RepID=A0A0E9XQL6_ANGAN
MVHDVCVTIFRF